MKKILLGILGVALVLPMAASAATLDSQAVFNGQTNVWGNAGQSVRVTLRVNAVAGEVVHAIQTRVGNQPAVCTAISPFEGAQSKDVTVNVTLPPNTGSNINLTADVFTTNTLPQANTLTGDLACTGASNNLYNGNTVNVIPQSTGGGSTSTPTPTEDPTITALKAQIASLTTMVQQLLASLNTGGGSTPTGTKCQAYTTASTGSVSTFQRFLLDNQESIPALSAGAAFGYYGPQTQAAAAHFRLVNKCA